MKTFSAFLFFIFCFNFLFAQQIHIKPPKPGHDIVTVKSPVFNYVKSICILNLGDIVSNSVALQMQI